MAWLPLAHKTFEQVPVLPFILGLSPGNFMTAERLLDLVDNRFYDSWAVGEDGCIIMEPQRPWVPFE